MGISRSGTTFGNPRPTGAGKGRIRKAMDSDVFNYSVSDRTAARKADNALSGATNAPPAPQINQPTPSRLDASPTPRLDAQNQGATQASRMEEQRAATQKSAMSGAFGQGAQKKAENLQGRQNLFQDMQAVGGGSVNQDMEQRAEKLGVNPSRFRQVAGSIPAAPASIASPTAPAMAVKSPYIKGFSSETPSTSSASSSQTDSMENPDEYPARFQNSSEQGRNRARQNIAKMGADGAAADYLQRDKAEKMVKAKERPVSAPVIASSNPEPIASVDALSVSPVTAPRNKFRGMGKDMENAATAIVGGAKKATKKAANAISSGMNTLAEMRDRAPAPAVSTPVPVTKPDPVKRIRVSPMSRGLTFDVTPKEKKERTKQALKKERQLAKNKEWDQYKKDSNQPISVPKFLPYDSIAAEIYRTGTRYGRWAQRPGT